MTQNLSKPGGGRLWNTNELLSSTGQNDMGLIAEQGLWDGLAAGLFNGRDGFIGAGCKPSKGAGELDWVVDPGMAAITLTGTAFTPDLTPIFVDVQETGILDPHDGVNPRIDIITVAPKEVFDEEGVVQIFNGPFLTPVPKYTRRRRSFTLLVTEGTPAPVPVAPAVPAGHLLVGQFGIPAVSGAMTVADARQLTGLASSANQHRPWKPEPTSLMAKVGDSRTAIIQILTLEGDSSPAPEGWPADNDQRYYMEASIYDDDHVYDSSLYQITSSPNETSTNKSHVLFKVAAGTPNFSVTVTDITTVYTGKLYLQLKPIIYYDDTLTERSKGGVPVTIEMDWS